MSATIADFIDQAWNDHADDPRAVAARLGDARPLLTREPGQVGAFVWLLEHVLLGHLGDVQAIEPWLAELAPMVAGQPNAQPAFDRARLAQRLLRGGAAEPGEFAAAVMVRARGTAALGHVSHGDFARARSLMHGAAAIAREAGDPDSLKALAAGYNNLADHLRGQARQDSSDALMLEAAAAARGAWQSAGTWMNVERADYLLALCAVKVGDGAQAVAHAQSCLALCEANAADAYERFFAHQALAEARRTAGDAAGARNELARMTSLLAEIDDASGHAYAQSTLDKLAAALG